MRDGLELYKIWAPDSETVCWSVWAKPVLFTKAPATYSDELNIPKIEWMANVNFGTAVIVDLPGNESVKEGLGLARVGYRPVPLFNGVQGPSYNSDIVNVAEIISALHSGADELLSAPIHYDAPPAFLLDSNRMTGNGKQPGKFDNRWCVFPQDMPSAGFLLEKGIYTIIVRADGIQNDLAHILMRYQEKGIRVYLYGKNTGLVEKTMVKPSKFKSMMYRFGVILGLRRNATGGFGGQIPEATQSTGSSGYYRIG